MQWKFRCVAALTLGCGALLAQIVPRDVVLPPSDPPEVLEAKLKADPDNEKLRFALLAAYSRAGNSVAFDQQVLWLIQNQPESFILAAMGWQLNSAADYDQATADWDVQLSQHSDSAKVLFNAAAFFKRRDPVRAINLLEQARPIAPETPSYVEEEASLYMLAMGKPAPPLTQENADVLKARLLESSDPELLSTTGRMMARKGADAETQKLGLQLMERAVSLDPSNPKWQAARDSARKFGTAASAPEGAVRIGGLVAEANLIRKVAPVYPELAKSASVEGSVEFVTTIDKDGAVQNLQLIRGHPLLVNAAKEAVEQWRYRPTLLNGNLVAVITDVIVNFSLKQ